MKSIKQLKTELKSWWAAREERLFNARFTIAITDKNSPAFRAVKAFSLQQAKGMVGNWLTNHNIHHCCRCNEIGQLRNILAGKGPADHVCETCYLREAAELQSKQEPREPQTLNKKIPAGVR